MTSKTALIYLECEYGFGPVTPCQIYLGEDIVGVVESEKTSYILKMNQKEFPLNKTYLEAIKEAEEAVKKQLNIFRQRRNMPVFMKRVSLSFYGELVGNPYDYHKIIKATCDDEILEILFEQYERLLIYQPENITNTGQELKIANAHKVKYITHAEKTREYQTITYTMDGENLSKETKYGVERLTINEPLVAAVHMVNF